MLASTKSIYRKKCLQVTKMNVENNHDNKSSKTVTSVISRSIKPGYEKDYDDWVQRYLALERKALGYLGTTIILPGGTSSNLRYIIRRFTDRPRWKYGTILKNPKSY
jgi:hypothetical protein